MLVVITPDARGYNAGLILFISQNNILICEKDSVDMCIKVRNLKPINNIENYFVSLKSIVFEIISNATI